MSHEYLTNPPYIADRTADYDAQEKINEAFRCLGPEDEEYKNIYSLCGNIHDSFFINKETKKAFASKADYFSNERKQLEITHERLYKAMSAALLLYRTICVIKSPHVFTDGADGYKVPWKIYLYHNKTKKILCISEWKGAISFRTEFHSMNEVPDEFLKDMLLFMDTVFGDNSPHPYDSLVAGSVA